MPRVVYNIPENTKEEVLQSMKNEKNTVIKERLLQYQCFQMEVKKTLLELSENTILLSQYESRFSSERNRITSRSTKGVAVSY